MTQAQETLKQAKTENETDIKRIRRIHKKALRHMRDGDVSGAIQLSEAVSYQLEQLDQAEIIPTTMSRQASLEMAVDVYEGTP